MEESSAVTDWDGGPPSVSTSSSSAASLIPQPMYLLKKGEREKARATFSVGFVLADQYGAVNVFYTFCDSVEFDGESVLGCAKIQECNKS